MKKIFSLLSGIMLLCILPAKAQMDSLFIDTVEINTSFEHMVDSCFEHLDLNEVPTGLLLEKAYATIDVKEFNGTCNDSNMATTWLWRKAYGTLRRAFIDSTAAYDTLGKIVHVMQVYVDSGYMPVALLNYNYNSFSPSALDDSLLYAVVRLIPRGRVTSYGAIARYLDAARSARMVGWAMNNAHSLVPPIAVHRVVNSAGLLTSKANFGSPERMQQLLEKEGIVVKNDQVQQFDEVFWDPMKELEL